MSSESSHLYCVDYTTFLINSPYKKGFMHNQTVRDLNLANHYYNESDCGKIIIDKKLIRRSQYVK